MQCSQVAFGEIVLNFRYDFSLNVKIHAIVELLIFIPYLHFEIDLLGIQSGIRAHYRSVSSYLHQQPD